MIGGLVLAAGAATRFGALKQLAELDGRPLLEHVAATLAASSLDRVCVVLGSDAGEVCERVDLHGAQPVVCEQWASGQAASLRAGLDALADAEAAVVVLGDQPLIAAAAVDRVAAAWRGGTGTEVEAARASYGGVPGHPILLGRSLFARLRELSGDVGARALLAHARVADVPCDGLGSPADIDTREQLDALAGGGRTTNEEAVSV